MDLGTPFDYNASTCSREACDVRFAYLSKEEIQGLSAKQITSTEVFSKLGNALDAGLHSSYLGALDSKENPNPSCMTCGLQKECPGHMGHIELACTLYNPFLFDNMVKLLGKMCLSCSTLKATETCSTSTARMLDQLQDGEVAKVPPKVVQSKDGKGSALSMEVKPADEHEELLRWEHHLPDGTVTTTTEVLRKRGNKEMSESAGEISTVWGDASKEALAERDRKRARALATRESELATLAESSSLEAYRAVIHDYFTNIPAKCPKCSAPGTKWRKVGYTKVFCKKNQDDLFCMPSYLREVLTKLWENEKPMLSHLLPALRGVGPGIFFLDAVLVPPNRFRPPGVAVRGSTRTLHIQTAAMREIMECNEGMRNALDQHQEQEVCKAEGTVWQPAKKLYGAKAILNPFEACGTLQDAVNIFLDSAKGERQQKLLQNGIRQLLEKKAGLFRMKMMGKRVNFAARSVISPDPNLETAEIGIPTFIASELSYPEVGTEYNVEELRKLIIRGKEYPGAKEVHEMKANGSKKVYRLQFMSPELRESLSKKLITDLEKGTAPMTVFRHLRNGDPLLVNRQPTLHKPGIMAHVVKVLKKEKTIRMHYANCNTYNADFDGDEMNLHAPQDPIGRMEALGIAKADRQYLVPTSGKPLRGLIQDNVIAGVMLTKRDTYFDKSDVCMLLYGGLRAVVENGDLPTDWTPSTDDQAKTWLTPDLMAHVQKHKLKLDPPCVFKPKMMWSGKQLLSMLIKNVLLIEEAKNPPSGADSEAAVAGGNAKRGLFLTGKSKTPGDIWKGKMDGNKEESTVIFHDTDLLQGILDKNQFGATSFSIIHTLFEVCGGHVVGMVLSSFCRIFLLYLQVRGFTCAFHDLLLTSETEKKRNALIVKSREVSTTCVEEWLSKHEVSANQAGDKATLAELSEAARGLMETDAKSAQALEGAQLGKMQQSWTNTIDACVPAGQLIPFPRNCFASMVQTGAKGSKVNHSQVSCLLGQQELEGRQVPLMPTGRSLPSFAPFDMAIRTRGFITDRFLTGIRPQEFFFHCMAGREGLVDTAVKTSRSGYLQRCLVKHLEGIKVDYDLTVRDADGTVVQFLYGEDGIDVTRSSHLLKFQELRDNFGALGAAASRDLAKLRAASGAVDMEAALELSAARKLAVSGDRKKAAKKVGKVAEMPNMPDSMRAMLLNAKEQIALAHPKCPAGEILDPIASLLCPGHFLGATSEKHELELAKHLGNDESEEAKRFGDFARLHFMRSLVEPGEAVGVVAAQSMGEPSTQMTLNTFHLAGHGGANVTLGIPRLREIVQTASAKLSTPLMQIKILQDEAGDTSAAARRKFGHQFCRQFRRVALQDILARVAVQERVTLAGGQVVTAFHCQLEFWPIEELMSQIPYLNREVLEAFMTKTFYRKLSGQVKTLIMRSRAKVSPSASKVARQQNTEEGQEVGMGEEADQAHTTPAAKAAKPKKRMRIGGRTADDDEADEAEEAEADATIDKDDADDESEDSGMYSEDAAEGEKEAKDLDEDDEKEAFGDDDDEDEVDKDVHVKKEREDKKEHHGDIYAKLTAAQAAIKATLEQGIEQAFDDAQESGLLIQPGKLRKNDITFIITIKSSDCAQKLLISEVLKDLLEKVMLQDPVADGIMKVHVQNENNKGEIWLECEGVNLAALHHQPRGCLDLEHIKSNDIAAIFRTYGVEAGRANIVKQIADVFGHYGIEVNHRHLSLIADHMSQAGGFRAFNRKAMENCSSPLLAMSYETTMQFMNQACQTAHSDNMRSPTASIVLGLPPAVGTGMVSLLVDLKSGMREKSSGRKFVF